MSETKADFKGQGAKMSLAERSQGVLDALNRLRNEIANGAALDVESDAALVKLESAISKEAVPAGKAKAERPRSLRKPLHTSIPALPSSGRRPEHKDDAVVEELKLLKQKSLQEEKELLSANKDRARLQKTIDFLKREQAEQQAYAESLLSQQGGAMQVLEAKFAETHRSMNKMKAREAKIQEERLRSERLFRTKRRENEALQKKVIELQEEISKLKQPVSRGSKKPRPKELPNTRPMPAKEMAAVQVVEGQATELATHVADENDSAALASEMTFTGQYEEELVLNEGFTVACSPESGVQPADGGQLNSVGLPSFGASDTSSLRTMNVLPGTSLASFFPPSAHDEPLLDNIENDTPSGTKDTTVPHPSKVNAGNPPTVSSARNGKVEGKSFSGPRNSLARSVRRRTSNSSTRTPVTSTPQHQSRSAQVHVSQNVQPRVRGTTATPNFPEPAIGSPSASQNSRLTDDSLVPPPSSVHLESADQLATLHPNASYMTLTSTVAIASDVEASNAGLSKSPSEVLPPDVASGAPSARSGAPPELFSTQQTVPFSTSPRAMGSSAVPLASIPGGHTPNSNNTPYVPAPASQAPRASGVSFGMAPQLHGTGPSFTRVVHNTQNHAVSLQTPGFVPVTPSDPMFASPHPPMHCEDDSNAPPGLASPRVAAIAGPSPFAYVPAQSDGIVAQQQLYAGGNYSAMVLTPHHSSTVAGNLSSLSQPGSPNASGRYIPPTQMPPSAQIGVPILAATTRVLLPQKHPTAATPVTQPRVIEPPTNEINGFRTQANPGTNGVGGVPEGSGRGSIIQHRGMAYVEVPLGNSCSAQDFHHRHRNSVTTPLQAQQGAQSSFDLRASPWMSSRTNAPFAAHLKWPQPQLSPSQQGSPKAFLAQQRGIRTVSPFRWSGSNLGMLETKALLSPRINLRDIHASSLMHSAQSPFSRANTSAYFPPRTSVHSVAPLHQPNPNALNWMAPCP